jgi:hypothetical protein
VHRVLGGVHWLNLTLSSLWWQEFLYEHSYEDNGEILVDIKEALRSLDIWHLDQAPTSSAATAVAGRPKSAQDPSTRVALLESKNKKLTSVVSNIRSENIRLSLELEASRASRTSPEGSSPSRTIGGARSSPGKSQYGSNSTSSSTSPSKKANPTPVVASHEEELADIANELT